ncbi:hypothetical protein SAMN04515671_0085 [Nakamurella panacisegetis]|uniref:Phage terminase, small subunit, putative, P27 family n=1 Tax=Nakamurella panacisegetis TaxID=1090615 RepID=A0A1H0HIL4_9ACTN|nr:hypothetical protein [Nakamurella panacisegetis]SDO18947.1 hypothetical protein SAMN04515671_0085 [Nakamurella panacisegetis]
MAEFDPSQSETEILTEICRTLDNLDALNAAIAANGAMVDGSKGQRVVNPCLTEVRGQRLALHRLIAALGIPDDEGDSVPSVTKLRASKAASARWSGHRREVARRVVNGVE